MSASGVPEFAVIGHPNEGKSAVVSTLAEDDGVMVSPTPGETLVCRKYPVSMDGREIVRFVDTPGFQMPRRALAWMNAYDGPPEQMLQAFIARHGSDADFKNECELLAPVAEGACIIYVADGSRPVRPNDRFEMEILRLTARPRMAIINSKSAAPEFQEEWKNEFRKTFNAFRVFNAHNASYAERIKLLEALKTVDPDREPVLETVIEAFVAEWKRRTRAAADLICDLLNHSQTYTISKRFGTPSEEDTLRSELTSQYPRDMSAYERRIHHDLRRLFKHRRFDVDLPAHPILGKDLFHGRTWEVLGLSRTQLATTAAIGGGMAGAVLDLAAHGISFGVFTAIGGLAAAGSSLLLGDRLSKVKLVGEPLGGNRLTIGPNENPQFLFILLDRVFIYYRQIINWAHGRRDYPDPETAGATAAAAKEGVTASWDSAKRQVCLGFFRAMRGGNPRSIREARQRLFQLVEAELNALAGE